MFSIFHAMQGSPRMFHLFVLGFYIFSFSPGKTGSTLNPGRDPHPDQLAKSARKVKVYRKSESRMKTRPRLDPTDDY